MADIIAGVAGRAADTEGDVERAEHHLYRAMIKRYIAANLETPSLWPTISAVVLNFRGPACTGCSKQMAAWHATSRSSGSIAP
ncbi:hypothetical protein [Bradyrhizobium sp. LTSPM299]|uniref:hypothetical protein n=1 Tax=Bradyrhizobium sp. LTSPM299 TaxID=1619233 RepID=UPI001FDAB2F6|nr:hypothetical protein [Bradyrhizobium sp. LTSPM299]